MTRRDDADFGAMTCREFVELVTEYLDGQLDADTRARFERHVAQCPGCATYLDQIHEATQLLGRVALDSISPEARGQLLNAFRSWRSGRLHDSG